jgi:hypothetical protein
MWLIPEKVFLVGRKRFYPDLWKPERNHQRKWIKMHNNHPE